MGIPRAAFARKTGVPESVLIRLDHLRSPLLYSVFKRIDRAFPINTYWLSTGNATPAGSAPIDDSAFCHAIEKHSLFSEVYDRFLKSDIEEKVQMLPKVQHILNALAALPHLLEAGLLTRNQARKMIGLNNELLGALPARVEFDREVKQELEKVISAMPQKEGLTDTASENKTENVKELLPNLRARLNKLTQSTGKKTELAEFLGAPLASVSRWLSGDREPGGEVALKMLHWVERQERK